MLLELSYELSENIPVYPGSPREEFKENTRIMNGDPSNTTIITHYLHNGSHVDAPFHFDKDGAGIHLVQIETFYFQSPLVVNCKKNRSELILLHDVMEYEKYLNTADILLFNTQYSRLRNDPKKYADDFPSLSLEVASFIRNELTNVKAVGIDTLSIESAILGPKLDFPVHKMLLDHKTSEARPLVIYEDIHIDLIRDKKVKNIWAFPLRLRGLDGSPVNMVAEV